MTPSLNIAVVGAGAVGQEMLRVLRQRSFPAGSIRVLARTARTIDVDGVEYQVEPTTPESFEGVGIALFAGTEGEKGAALTYGPEAIKRGAVVIDNGSDRRMDEEVPLVVPEVNPEDLDRHRGFIANPNCSTIQMVHALKPLLDLAPVREVVVSTYQSVSGAGAPAVAELEAQVQAVAEGRPMPEYRSIPAQLAMNVLAGCWRFRPDGFQDEEWKMIVESRKILHMPDLRITPTAVRVPVAVGHAESLWVRFDQPVTVEQAREALSRFPGIRVVDDPAPTGADPNARSAPSPLDAAGGDETLVGRLRQDPHDPAAILLWVVADNLRKGAALNAVQIAEELVRRGCLAGRSGG